MQETIKVDKVERKKTKFVNIYSQDGKEREILLKGILFIKKLLTTKGL